MPDNAPMIVPASGQDNPLVPVTLEALDAIERSRIDLQIAAAKRNPRAAIEIIEKRITERAARRVAIAELCYYSLPRYDKYEQRRRLNLRLALGVAQPQPFQVLLAERFKHLRTRLNHNIGCTADLID